MRILWVKREDAKKRRWMRHVSCSHWNTSACYFVEWGAFRREVEFSSS
jgi:hypothetical protein